MSASNSPPPSPFDWGRPEWLRETLGTSFELGFEPGVLFHRTADCDDAVELFVNGFGPVKFLVDALEPDQRSAATASLKALHEPYAGEIGVSVPYDYLIALGTRI